MSIPLMILVLLGTISSVSRFLGDMFEVIGVAFVDLCFENMLRFSSESFLTPVFCFLNTLLIASVIELLGLDWILSATSDSSSD